VTVLDLTVETPVTTGDGALNVVDETTDDLTGVIALPGDLTVADKATPDGLTEDGDTPNVLTDGDNVTAAALIEDVGDTPVGVFKAPVVMVVEVDDTPKGRTDDPKIGALTEAAVVVQELVADDTAVVTELD